jgi:hypothetical protein
VLASLAAQTHVALLPIALMLGGAAFARVVWNTPPVPPAGTSRLRAVILTLIVLLVCWLPPLIEQLTSRPGNMTQIFNFFVHDSGQGQTGGNALSAWSDMLTGVARRDFYVAHGWKFLESPVRWAEPLALLQLLALALFSAHALRTRKRFEAMLALVLLASGLLALWSASRIEGAIFDHEVFWISGVGAMTAAVVIAFALEFAAGFARSEYTLPRLPPTALACALIAIAAYRGTSELMHIVRTSQHPDEESAMTNTLSNDLEAYLTKNGAGRPLVRIDQDTWGIAAGVILRLQKDGFALAVEDDWLPMFTPVFKRNGGESMDLTIAGKAQHVRMEGTAGDEVVIARDPMYVHRSSAGSPAAIR